MVQTKNNTNLKELLSLLNDTTNKLDNYSYVEIFFNNGYTIELQITNNKPYIPSLYHNNEFYGVYWSYFEDMLYHNGLFIDNKEFEFKYFDLF